MESDSENEFVDATEFIESDPALSGSNSRLVLNNAYHYFVNQLSINAYFKFSTDSVIHVRVLVALTIDSITLRVSVGYTIEYTIDAMASSFSINIQMLYR